jgi:hypothetical protein
MELFIRDMATWSEDWNKRTRSDGGDTNDEDIESNQPKVRRITLRLVGDPLEELQDNSNTTKEQNQFDSDTNSTIVRAGNERSSFDENRVVDEEKTVNYTAIQPFENDASTNHLDNGDGISKSVRVLQSPGGDSTLQLGEEIIAIDSRSSIRVLQQPGGQSSLNLGNDYDATDQHGDFVDEQSSTHQVSSSSTNAIHVGKVGGEKLSVKVQQDPGGRTTLTIGQDDIEPSAGLSDETKASIKVLQSPGGVSSINLTCESTNASGSEVSKNVVKVLQEPGGNSSLNLRQEMPEQLSSENNPTNVRVLQSPGGHSTISFNNNADIAPSFEEHQRHVRILQAPGGRSSITLGSEGEREDDDITRKSVRVLQAPGGRSSVNIHIDSKADNEDEGRRSVRVLQQPGGQSSVRLGYYDVDVANTVDKNKLSVRVLQSPGGRISLSLSHLDTVDAHDNRREEKLMEPLADEQMKESIQIIEKETQAEAIGGIGMRSELRPLELLALRIIDRTHEDIRSKLDDLIERSLGSFQVSLALLASKLGVIVPNEVCDHGVNTDRYSNSPFIPRDDSSENHLHQRLEFNIRKYLLELLQKQCLLLDYAVLLTYLNPYTKSGPNILTCIDAVNDMCLVSPRSDFLMIFTSQVLDSHTFLCRRMRRPFRESNALMLPSLFHPETIAMAYKAAATSCVMTSRETKTSFISFSCNSSVFTDEKVDILLDCIYHTF